MCWRSPGKVVSTPAKAGGAEYGSSLQRLPGRPHVRVLRLAHSARRRRFARQPARRRAPPAGARSVRAADHDRSAPRTHAALRLRRVRAGARRAAAGSRACALGAYRVRVAVLAGKGERPLPGRARCASPSAASRSAHVAPVPAADADRSRADAAHADRRRRLPGAAARTRSAARTRASAPGAPATCTRARTSAPPSGTPVVAPLAGQILFNDYQAQRRRPLRRSSTPTTAGT